MSNPVLLNNIDHRDLRVETARGARFGDDVMSALTFPAEFRNVQAHYPIVFQKDAKGDFQPVALFGLQPGRNVFLQGDRWDAWYLPLALERQPFLIGVADGEPMIHVDIDHPRVRSGTGQLVFREHGGTTDYLDRINSILLALHDGVRRTPGFIRSLLQHDLLEPFVLDVQPDDESRHRLAGYHTINEERLAALDAPALGELAAIGHLQPIYMAIASLSCFRDLIERHRREDARA